MVFVRVSVFVRRLASCEVTFVGPFVDRRICPVLRVRSLLLVIRCRIPFVVHRFPRTP